MGHDVDTLPSPQEQAEAEALLKLGGLGTPHVRMSEAEAGDLVARHFGVAGTLVRFSTEKDDTFLVSPATGPRFVLKVANPMEDREELDLQAKLLLHVEARDPSLPVPRVVRDRQGRAVFDLQDAAGQHRHVRALSFLDGTPVDRLETTRRDREWFGAHLARLRLAMAGFAHPCDQRVIAWDVKHVLRLRGLVAHVEDRAHRSAIMQGLARLQTLQADIAALPAQVVHNDASRSNVVADRAHPAFVTGIIDFGDVVRTAIAIDVATALLNQLSTVETQDILADARDVLAGYLAVAPLGDDELRLIPHLVMARVIARALITTWRAAVMPENAAYVLRNTRPGWYQLGWFLNQSPDAVSRILLDRPRPETPLSFTASDPGRSR